jgi:hypothetical protein
VTARNLALNYLRHRRIERPEGAEKFSICRRSDGERVGRITVDPGSGLNQGF